jgi:hypothetical protein
MPTPLNKLLPNWRIFKVDAFNVDVGCVLHVKEDWPGVRVVVVGGDAVAL